MRFALLATTLALAGCAESPADGFEAFYAAVVDQDADKALARTTPRMRRQLEAGALAAGLPLSTVLRDAMVRSTLRSIAEVSRTEDDATLEVTDALGKKEQVRMRKVDGAWRVDLPSSSDGGEP